MPQPLVPRQPVTSAAPATCPESPIRSQRPFHSVSQSSEGPVARSTRSPETRTHSPPHSPAPESTFTTAPNTIPTPQASLQARLEEWKGTVQGEEVVRENGLNEREKCQDGALEQGGTHRRSPLRPLPSYLLLAPETTYHDLSTFVSVPTPRSSGALATLATHQVNTSEALRSQVEPSRHLSHSLEVNPTVSTAPHAALVPSVMSAMPATSSDSCATGSHHSPSPKIPVSSSSVAVVTANSKESWMRLEEDVVVISECRIRKNLDCLKCDHTRTGLSAQRESRSSRSHLAPVLSPSAALPTTYPSDAFATLATCEVGSVSDSGPPSDGGLLSGRVPTEQGVLDPPQTWQDVFTSFGAALAVHNPCPSDVSATLSMHQKESQPQEPHQSCSALAARDWLRRERRNDASRVGA